MADVDWDGWLDRLIKDEAARTTADVRAQLIAEIRQAITNSDELQVNDADRLAEIAVDSMIKFSRKNQIRPS